MRTPFKQISEKFLRNLDIRDNSRALYGRILSQFSRWVVCSNKNIKTLIRSDIIEFKSSMLEAGKSENTIDSYLTVVRMFFEYCESIGEHENIAAGIRLRHKKVGYRKSHLTQTEIKTLKESIDRDSIIGKRNYALIHLMLHSGIRCVEAARLRVCDIVDRDNITYIVLQRKGDNDRKEKLPVSHMTIEPLMKYLSYRGVSNREESVFLSHRATLEKPLSAECLGKIIVEQMKTAGVYDKTKTAHSLRHSFAVHCILHQVPIKNVQLALGHRRVETTEIYLKSVEEELRMNNPIVCALDDAF